MALTIPASDLQGTLLLNNVNNLGTLITANSNNVALINAQYDAQLKLAIYLLATGYISPATVIAGTGATYIGPPSNNQGV
jgi:hypothetical protein